MFSDIMSYCQANQWTSNCAGTGILNYRASSPSIVSAAAAFGGT